MIREFDEEVLRTCRSLAQSNTQVVYSEHEEISKKMIEWHDRKILGNRLQVMISTGAPLAHNVSKFLFRIIGKVIINGYGTTETGGLVTNGRINKGNGIEIRLLDVESLGYKTSDKPFPRGEILAHTPKLKSAGNGYFSKTMMSNYSQNKIHNKIDTQNDNHEYSNIKAAEEAAAEKEEEEEEEDFVTLGGLTYFRTGDIGELLNNGEIRIIDRCKSCFKLNQGVFIAPQQIENFLLESKWISQIFIWGNVSACVV